LLDIRHRRVFANGIEAMAHQHHLGRLQELALHDRVLVQPQFFRFDREIAPQQQMSQQLLDALGTVDERSTFLFRHRREMRVDVDGPDLRLALPRDQVVVLRHRRRFGNSLCRRCAEHQRSGSSE
jgi:hypothetical protein